MKPKTNEIFLSGLDGESLTVTLDPIEPPHEEADESTLDIEIFAQNSLTCRLTATDAKELLRFLLARFL